MYMSLCPCGSQKLYGHCCAPFHEGRRDPATCEALMRSRYSAFVVGNFTYIEQSMQGDPSREFSRKEAEQLFLHIRWKGLQILSHEEEGERGQVHFIAYYDRVYDQINPLSPKERVEIEERSRFEKREGRWYYVGGDTTIRSR